MIRFLLSLLVLVLIVTYLIIPAIKYIKKLGKSEAERINDVFNEDKTSKFTTRKEESK